jgi:hypothetical protein
MFIVFLQSSRVQSPQGLVSAFALQQFCDPRGIGLSRYGLAHALRQRGRWKKTRSGMEFFA